MVSVGFLNVRFVRANVSGAEPSFSCQPVDNRENIRYTRQYAKKDGFIIGGNDKWLSNGM